MSHRHAKAEVTPVRQRTQYNCMTTSLHMALLALGVPESECSVQMVNKVVGAMPLYGAAWEPLLAAANHYGMRSTLTMPSTVRQLKSWTDAGSPVIIGWNPENREWSHASLVFDVTEDEEHGFLVHVADPNIPDPDETVRIVPKKEFYSKWYEKSPQGFMIRRPACVIEREISNEGRQVMASNSHPGMSSLRKAVVARWVEVHVDDDGNFFTSSRSGRFKPGTNFKTGIYFGTRGGILQSADPSEPATKGHDDRYWREFYKLWAHLTELSGDAKGAAWLSKHTGQGFSKYPDLVSRYIPNKKSIYDHHFPINLVQLRRMVEDQHDNLSLVTPEDLEQFKRVWMDPYHYEFPENMEKIHGKRAADKWKGMGWVLLQRRTFSDDDPYRDRNQSQTFEVYMLTTEGRKVLSMDASDLPDYVPAKGKPRPLPQYEDLEPEPVPEPKAPQKTVVDSGLSEKFAILDQLISNGFPQAQAVAKAVKDVYLTGGKPSDDQLKALRNMMYRSRMKAEADQFRVAAEGRFQPDSTMIRGVVASFLAKTHAAKLATGAKLPDRRRADINNALVKAGLDGNGRFNKPEAAYSRALDVLADYGIELDTVVSSHLFKNRPTVTIPIRVAFSNPDDPFSPVSISNSMLYLQSTELRPNVFEAVVYMS